MEDICQKLADEATAEMERHLQRKTPEDIKFDTAKWALDGMGRPQVLHHFRLMKQSTSHTKDAEKDFNNLISEMATFCSAARDHPGLADVLSGLCENVFDPISPDYNPEHHEEAVSLVAENWPVLTREGTGNDLPLRKRSHSEEDGTAAKITDGTAVKTPKTPKSPKTPETRAHTKRHKKIDDKEEDDNDDEGVVLCATFGVSDNFDVSKMQVLAQDIKSALRTKTFTYRKKNRKLEGHVHKGDGEKMINFIFYQTNRLPILLQRILQQFHALPSQAIVGDAHTTIQDLSVPLIVRKFASTWLESCQLDERSALMQIQKVALLASLHTTFKSLCEGLKDRGMDSDFQLQDWANDRDRRSRKESTEGSPASIRSRGRGWASIAKRALIFELQIDPYKWDQATRRWPLVTPFIDAFGIGVIPFFTGDKTPYSILNFRYTSMLPAVVNTIKEVDESHGKPLGRVFELVGAGIMEGVLTSMRDGDNRSQVAQPSEDEEGLMGDGTVCERLSLLGLTGAG